MDTSNNTSSPEKVVSKWKKISPSRKPKKQRPHSANSINQVLISVYRKVNNTNYNNNNKTSATTTTTAENTTASTTTSNSIEPLKKSNKQNSAEWPMSSRKQSTLVAPEPEQLRKLFPSTIPETYAIPENANPATSIPPIYNLEQTVKGNNNVVDSSIIDNQKNDDTSKNNEEKRNNKKECILPGFNVVNLDPVNPLETEESYYDDKQPVNNSWNEGAHTIVPLYSLDATVVQPSNNNTFGVPLKQQQQQQQVLIQQQQQKELYNKQKEMLLIQQKILQEKEAAERLRIQALQQQAFLQQTANMMYQSNTAATRTAVIKDINSGQLVNAIAVPKNKGFTGSMTEFETQQKVDKRRTMHHQSPNDNIMFYGSNSPVINRNTIHPIQHQYQFPQQVQGLIDQRAQLQYIQQQQVLQQQRLLYQMQQQQPKQPVIIPLQPNNYLLPKK